jgi:hypothetical protein
MLQGMYSTGAIANLICFVQRPERYDITVPYGTAPYGTVQLLLLLYCDLVGPSRITATAFRQSRIVTVLYGTVPVRYRTGTVRLFSSASRPAGPRYRTVPYRTLFS